MTESELFKNLDKEKNEEKMKSIRKYWKRDL